MRLEASQILTSLWLALNLLVRQLEDVSFCSSNQSLMNGTSKEITKCFYVKGYELGLNSLWLFFCFLLILLWLNFQL
jgi:hypothetical protein